MALGVDQVRKIIVTELAICLVVNICPMVGIFVTQTKMTISESLPNVIVCSKSANHFALPGFLKPTFSTTAWKEICHGNSERIHSESLHSPSHTNHHRQFTHLQRHKCIYTHTQHTHTYKCVHTCVYTHTHHTLIYAYIEVGVVPNTIVPPWFQSAYLSSQLYSSMCISCLSNTHC